MRRRLRWGLAALAVGLFAPAAASAERPFDLGLVDPLFSSPTASTRDAWLDRARGAGADLTLLGSSWAAIAPAHRSPGFQPRNPGDPAYNWGTLDDAVRDARARGLRVVLTTSQAPSWAEGAHRPSLTRAAAGTWKPKPSALEDFGHALAKRYSGSFAPPSTPGATLPRVRHFQLWAEPNLGTYLNPQFKRRRPVAPKHYRKMLRGFYAGVKSAKRSNKVITGGTAPYGDPGSSGARMKPVRFWRVLLCLKGRELRKARCRKPAKFDIAAHHPINVGGPRRHAVNADDASTPDIGRITRVIRRARRTHRVLPKGHKPFWATEIWWDSRPPDPNGIPARRHARYLAESFFLLWKQHVRTVVWFHVRDPETTNFAATQESGLYRIDGAAKPALKAFRFPFAAERRSRRKVVAWGRSPAKGKVKLQLKGRRGWHDVARLKASRHAVFTRALHRRGKLKLRARLAGGTKSLPFTVR